MYTHFFSRITTVTCLLLFAFLCPSALAAQFTAELSITSPQEDFIYDLKVKDDLYRVEKIKGPINIPPLPTIYNRSTKITWGLIPQLKQYIEEPDPVRTIMMNPVLAWEFMRKNMQETLTGTETIEGYPCQVYEYRQSENSSVANRVWVSSELNFTLKEIIYALNGNATFALKNIQKTDLDLALFNIPPDYTKIDMTAASGKSNVHSKSSKRDRAKKPISTTSDIKRTSTQSIELKPNRQITISSTGANPEGNSSKVYMKVMDKDNKPLIKEHVILKNGEKKTWEISPEEQYEYLSLSGDEGLIRFQIDQTIPETTASSPEPVSKLEPSVAATTIDPESASTAETVLSPANIIFILDASGSMWGQVEGVAKITIAKDVLTGLIQDLPDSTVVGLVAYGHRRKGDCDDVEELITLGPLNKQSMIGKVQKLNPKGKTPISRSVRLTAKRIKHLEDETTIILVSDGKETCDPDPCALVKELKDSGIKFIMHVIGFDVTEEEKQELECMAKEGGGKYFTAANAKDFQLAAQEVVKKVTPTYGTLQITVSKNNKPFFTAVTITDLKTGKSWAPGSSSGETGIAKIQLEPGNYTAELKDLGVSGGKTPSVKLTDIVIMSGETVRRSADFSDGTLMITTLRNNIPFKGYVFYYRQGENKHFHNENTHPKTGQLKRKLLPGIYRIKVQTDSIVGKPVVIIDDLVIPPGSTVEKNVDFFSGEVTVASTLNGKPHEMPFKVFDSTGKQIYKHWSSGGQRLIRLAAGTYTIKVTTYVDKSTKSFENIIVENGQSQTVKAAFDFGKLTIAATFNGKPFSTPFKVYDSAGKQVLDNWTQKGQRTEMLAKGKYTIKVISIKDNKQVVMFENINIVIGQSQTVTANFPMME